MAKSKEEYYKEIEEGIERDKKKGRKKVRANKDRLDNALHSYINQPLANIGLPNVGAGIAAAGGAIGDMFLPDEEDITGMAGASGPSAFSKAGKAKKALNKLEKIDPDALKAAGKGKSLVEGRQDLADQVLKSAKARQSPLDRGIKGSVTKYSDTDTSAKALRRKMELGEGGTKASVTTYDDKIKANESLQSKIRNAIQDGGGLRLPNGSVVPKEKLKTLLDTVHAQRLRLEAPGR